MYHVSCVSVSTSARHTKGFGLYYQRDRSNLHKNIQQVVQLVLKVSLRLSTTVPKHYSPELFKKNFEPLENPESILCYLFTDNKKDLILKIVIQEYQSDIVDNLIKCCTFFKEIKFS